MDDTDGGGSVRRHGITVRVRRIHGVPISIVSGSVRSDRLEFDLDDEWRECARGGVSVVVYPLDGGWQPQQAALDDDRSATLPDVAYGREGWLGMALVATDDETGEVVVTEECRHAIRVLPSAIGSVMLAREVGQ